MHDELKGDQLRQKLARLPDEMIERLINLARASGATSPRGEKGSAFVGRLPTFAADDLRDISQAIERHCNRVDEDGW